MSRLLGILLSLGTTALLLATVGCSSLPVQTHRPTGTPSFPPTNPATVEILREPPTRPNVKLGQITAEPQSASTPIAQVEAKLRLAGAKLGADAVVIVVETKRTAASAPGRWWDAQVSPDIGQFFVAVPIHYTNPKVAQRAAVASP